MSPDELQRRRDWLMFLWAIVNLILLIVWWDRLLAIGTV
jgi:predicted nucleic acid-binding Zn ribbon protein